MARSPYHHKRSVKSYRRPYGGHWLTKKRILIVCEGTRTESLYFKAFHITSVNVNVEGTGRNTDSLVEYTIEKANLARNNKEPYDQVWCVFDKDDFPAQNFNRAFDLARNNKIRIGYSNEAFELWYLLHFDFYTTGISRSQYKGKLTRLLGETYRKNDPDMYQKLLNKQVTAIQYAHNLLNSYPAFNPLHNNPSTTVVDLVEELNKYIN